MLWIAMAWRAPASDLGENVDLDLVDKYPGACTQRLAYFFFCGGKHERF